MARNEASLYLACLLCSLVVAFVGACASPRLVARATPRVEIAAAPVQMPPVDSPKPADLPPQKAPGESSLVAHIRQNLPLLKPGMTRGQVEKTLGLDERFHGVVNSQGGRLDFAYFYDLGDWELVIHFDYRDERDGSYLSATLGLAKDT